MWHCTSARIGSQLVCFSGCQSSIDVTYNTKKVTEVLSELVISLFAFQAANLPEIVTYNKKKVTEVHMEDLKLNLTEAINSDPPLPVEEIIEMIQQKRKEQELPDTEVIQVGPYTSIGSRFCC